MACAAMERGVYVGLEVGGAYSIKDCWRMVDTYEKTRVPVFLLGIGGAPGRILLGSVAVSSAAGIGLTVWDMDRTDKICTGLHLLNGWSVVLGFHWLIASVGWQGIAWMLAGGIVYSAGVVFFALGATKRGMHGVFHLFCLAATFCQFWGIYMYLL